MDFRGTLLLQAPNPRVIFYIDLQPTFLYTQSPQLLLQIYASEIRTTDDDAATNKASAMCSDLGQHLLGFSADRPEQCRKNIWNGEREEGGEREGDFTFGQSPPVLLLLLRRRVEPQLRERGQGHSAERARE